MQDIAGRTFTSCIYKYALALAACFSDRREELVILEVTRVAIESVVYSTVQDLFCLHIAQLTVVAGRLSGL